MNIVINNETTSFSYIVVEKSNTLRLRYYERFQLHMTKIIIVLMSFHE